MSTLTAQRQANSPADAQEVITLAIPSDVRLRVSDDDFWRLCQKNPGLFLERTSSGELVIIAPVGPDGSQRNASITSQLWNWNRQSKLGVAFDSSVGFTIPNTAIRGPDASWMTSERWAQIPQKERLRFSHVCPDFVVELRSTSDSLKDLRAKMREYLSQCARLGWLIDPIEGTVEIYRPGRDVETLQSPLTLSGEDVLPGFLLDLKGILFD